MQRPEFSRALAALQAGDTLVFWRSDRWGRSSAHVLTTVGELRDRGVTVKSLTESFDLDTKEGRFMFAVLAAAGTGPGEHALGCAVTREHPAGQHRLPAQRTIASCSARKQETRAASAGGPLPLPGFMFHSLSREGYGRKRERPGAH